MVCMETLFFDKKNKKTFYLIIYDIVDDKKRKKISDLIEGYGKRVQYSSYEVWLTEKQMQILMEKISRMHDENDSIRIYKLTQKPNIVEDDRNSIKLQYDIAICESKEGMDII